MVEFMVGVATTFGISGLVLLVVIWRAKPLDETDTVTPRGVERARRAR